MRIRKRKPQLRSELSTHRGSSHTLPLRVNYPPNRMVSVTDSNRKTSGTDPNRKCNYFTTPAKGRKTSIAQQQAQPMEKFTTQPMRSHHHLPFYFPPMSSHCFLVEDFLSCLALLTVKGFLVVQPLGVSLCLPEEMLPDS